MNLDRTMTRLESRIVEALALSPGLDVEELASAFDADDVAVYEAVAGLRRDGILGEDA